MEVHSWFGIYIAPVGAGWLRISRALHADSHLVSLCSAGTSANATARKYAGFLDLWKVLEQLKQVLWESFGALALTCHRLTVSIDIAHDFPFASSLNLEDMPT